MDRQKWGKPTPPAYVTYIQDLVSRARKVCFHSCKVSHRHRWIFPVKGGMERVWKSRNKTHFSSSLATFPPMTMCERDEVAVPESWRCAAILALAMDTCVSSLLRMSSCPLHSCPSAVLGGHGRSCTVSSASSCRVKRPPRTGLTMTCKLAVLAIVRFFVSVTGTSSG